MTIAKKMAKGAKVKVKTRAREGAKKQFPPVTITSALPYVNGVKHLGNIIGSLLPADIFHRFMDLFEIDNIYICATDEHGAATEIAALAEGLSPKEYSDKYSAIQRKIYQDWNFDFTFFGRTSSKIHHDTTREFFRLIYKNGFIKKDELTLPYCKKDKMFLADRYIEGTCPVCNYTGARGDQCEQCGRILDPTDLKDPYCTICKQKGIIFKKETHLFLDLSKVETDLRKWLMKNKHWPPTVRNYALGWIKDGLKPRCITRNLTWGIKVPLRGFSHLVFYVWFDAPIAYISVTKEAAENKLIKDWKKWWTKGKIYHFLGKDNIPFHTIFWPAILLAARDKETNYALPYYVAGYEYLNWEGEKFSTSRNIGLMSDRALELFPTDYWRFYLSSILPERGDSNFDWKDFQSRINNELIANYGNLFYRVTSFIKSHFGKVPRAGNPGTAENQIINKWKLSLSKIEKLVKKVKLRDALKEILILSDELNAYFQIKEPWFTVKNKTTRKDAATTLYHAVNILASITIMLKPYLPGGASQAAKALGIENLKWPDIGGFNVKTGSKIRAIILFQKIEDEEIEQAKKPKVFEDSKDERGKEIKGVFERGKT